MYLPRLALNLLYSQEWLWTLDTPACTTVQYWGPNSGLPACWASALLAKLQPQPYCCCFCCWFVCFCFWGKTLLYNPSWPGTFQWCSCLLVVLALQVCTPLYFPHLKYHSFVVRKKIRSVFLHCIAPWEITILCGLEQPRISSFIWLNLIEGRSWHRIVFPHGIV